MENIQIPHNLSISNCNMLALNLYGLPLEEEYNLLLNLGNTEPFGMLYAGAIIRQFFYRNKAKITADIHPSTSYPLNMGFYKSIGFNLGKKPGEGNISDNHLPIEYLNIKDLDQKAKDNKELIQETINSKAKDLSIVLSRGEELLNKYLQFSLREIMRNVIEHAIADKIWLAGQYWQTRDLVEIAILDEGMGIYESLSRNKKLNISNNEVALHYSLQPGISRMVPNKRNQYDAWANSGYGLFMTSSLCKNLGGDFVMSSGNKMIFVKDDKEIFYETNFTGTAIRLRLKPSQIQDSDLLTKISKEGRKIIQKKGSGVLNKPSKSSTSFMDD